jgi:hypothetical protein
MRKDKISSRVARSQAGQKLFGRDWIGKLGKKEYQLVREYGPRRVVYRVDGEMLYREIVPRIPKSLAAKVDSAVGRHIRSDLQQTRVYFWLLSHGFDCAQHDHFDRAAFDAVLVTAKAFETGNSALPQPGDYNLAPRVQPPRKRGRPTVIGPQIEQQMRKDIDDGRLTRQALSREKKSVLAKQYGCSPNWADEMRKKVLSDFRANGITDPK